MSLDAHAAFSMMDAQQAQVRAMNCAPGSPWINPEMCWGSAFGQDPQSALLGGQNYQNIQNMMMMMGSMGTPNYMSDFGMGGYSDAMNSLYSGSLFGGAMGYENGFGAGAYSPMMPPYPGGGIR